MACRYTCFLKVVIKPLCFYEKPPSHQHLFCQRNLEDFRFYQKKKKKKKKRQKVKIVFSVCFAASHYRGSVCPKQKEWPCQAPSLGTMLSRHTFEPCLLPSIFQDFLPHLYLLHTRCPWLAHQLLPAWKRKYDHQLRSEAISLLLCLILFLAQVYRHTKDALEPDLLWAYHINWWSDFLFTFSGIMSFLNYITFRFPPLDQNVTTSPTEKSRLGVGPVTKELPAEDEGLRSDMEAPTEEEKTAPEAEP
uniref:transmembrane protein 202 isoform X2 n=1 Tax=Panthera onca TaxID=9690 RepID=UPI002954E2B2|nr:transmembrane protein 202 isoform X2 [Panthera onca]